MPAWLSTALLAGLFAVLLAGLFAVGGAVAAVGTSTADATADTTADTVGSTTTDTAVATSAATAAESAASAQNATALEANLTVASRTVFVGETLYLDTSGSTGDVVETEYDLDSDAADLSERSSVDTVVYRAAGNYTIELTVVGPDGERDTDAVNVTVERLDLAADVEVSESDPVVGQPVQFEVTDATGPISDYDWTFDGEREFGLGAAQRRTFTEAGEHSVEVTVHSVYGQEYTATETLSVAPQNESATIDAAFEVSNADPEDDTVLTFDANASSGPIEQYFWEFGDHTESLETDPSVTHDYSWRSIFDVTLTVIGANATDSTTAPVVAGPPLNLTVTADHENATTAHAIDIDATSTPGAAEQYRVRPGDGTEHVSSSLGSFRYSYDEPGTYTVEVVAEFAGYENQSANTTVTVDPAEEFVDDLEQTSGDVVGDDFGFYLFDAARGVVEYRWDFGDGRTATTEQPVTSHEFTAAGNYTVEVTGVTDANDTDTAAVNVTVDPFETRNVLVREYDVPVVVGERAQFIVSEPGYLPNSTQHWDFGDGTTETLDEFSPAYHTYDEPGTYAVEGQIRSDGDLAARTTENVTVVTQNETGDIEAAIDVANETPTTHSYTQFDASPSTGNLTGFYWDLEERGLGEGKTARKWFGEPGTYDVTLTVVGENTTDETTVQVDVASKSGDDGGDADDDDSTGGGGIGAPSSGGPESQIEIASVDVPDAVEPGESFDVTIDAENTGDATGTTNVIVVIENVVDDSVTRELDAGADTEVTFTLAAPDEPGSYDVQASTADGYETVALSVEDDAGDEAEDGSDEGRADGEADEGSERDDGGAADDTAADGAGDADGTPGFGLGVAIVALAAALVARCRSSL